MGARAIESAFRGAERQSPPISILACGGGLPLEIARVLSDKGRSTNIVTIKGMADADYTGFPVTSVGIGELGGLLRALKRGGATEMLIAGHAQRPDLRNLKIDFGVITNIATIFRLMRGGDDHVLRQIANLFERNGLAVKSIAELAPELLTPAGVLAGEASPAIMSTADHGLRVIRRLGPFDIGQAVVASGDAILAIEGAEGTNGLIARSTVTHHGDSRFKMLVKAAKPSQDLRVDLPTIGTETIERCVAAGISAIALEAGRSLIVDRAATIRKSEASGIALIGITDGSSDDLSMPPHHLRLVADERLVSLARVTPSRQAQRDAAKGLRLFSVGSDAVPIEAALVGRENILALALNEPLDDFVIRTGQLGQWGDRRKKNTRNKTLILARVPEDHSALVAAIAESQVGGVVLLSADGSTAWLDAFIAAANARNLFVLSTR